MAKCRNSQNLTNQPRSNPTLTSQFGQTYKEYLSSDLMSWPSTPTPSPWDPSSSTPPPNSCSTFVVNNVHVIGYKMLKKRIKRLDGKRIVNGDNEERDEIVRELENQSKLVERTFIMRYNQICQQKLDSARVAEAAPTMDAGLLRAVDRSTWCAESESWETPSATDGTEDLSVGGTKQIADLKTSFERFR